MKKLLPLFIAVLLLASCQEVDMNFLVNGTDLPILEPGKQPVDTAEYLTVLSGYPVFFADDSDPADAVEQRFWDLDGDGIWEREYSDSAAFEFTYDHEGMYKVVYAANDEDDQIIKYVQVKSGMGDFVEGPSFQFIHPSSEEGMVDAKKMDVEVLATNYLPGDDLSLYNNFEAIEGFEVTDIGNGQVKIVARDVALKEGKNEFLVESFVDDGGGVDERAVVYRQTGTSGNPGGSTAAARAAAGGGTSSGGSIAQNNPSGGSRRNSDAGGSASSGTGSSASSGGSSQSSADQTPAETKPSEPKEPEPVADELDNQTASNNTASSADETDETLEPLWTFDHKNELKKSFTRKKYSGVQVASLDDLPPSCALAYTDETVVINITDVKEVFYFESLGWTKEAECLGTDVEVILRCTDDRTKGRSSGKEQVGLSYDQTKPVETTLYTLKRYPLIPGNSYRLEIRPKENTVLGYVETSCSKVVDLNTAKMTYADGKCPLFNVVIRH